MHMEPYCQKHNTSNLVFSPRSVVVLSTPAVALRTTPLLCRARSFFASLFSRRRRSSNTVGSMDQATRSLVRCDATQLPIAKAQIAEGRSRTGEQPCRSQNGGYENLLTE